MLTVLATLCSMLAVSAAAAGQYTVAISDDTAGTAVVAAGDTVTMKVSVSGADFNGLQASVGYDSELFTLTGVTGAAAADDDRTAGVVELYTLRHAPYESGSTVAELTFAAKAEGTCAFVFSGAVVGSYYDFQRGNAPQAATVGDSVTVKSGGSYKAEKIPAAVYWGNTEVQHGGTYRFGVNEGYDAAYAFPTVTMGGKAVAVKGSGTVSDPWRVTEVTGDLVIKSPEHRITFQSADPNISCPANTSAHYGQDCTFTLPKPVTCMEAAFGIEGAQPQKLTADPSGKVTVPGKKIIDDIVVTFAYQHTFGIPVYQWSEDYTVCTASRMCGKCRFEESETAESSYVVDPDGTMTFIAEFENPAFERQEIKTDFGRPIEVTFRLIGDTLHDNAADHVEYVTWIPTTTYEMKLGDSVYDVFAEALEEYGLRDRGAAGNYVRSIQAPAVLGDYWLEEYDNGPNSGWMYTKNDEHGQMGLKDDLLADGDEIIWHYVDDWSREESRLTWLEAADISPEQYARQYLGEILTVGEHGCVEPEELTLRDLGETVTFRFIPDEGYKVKNVTVDGVSMGSIETYTYKNLSISSRIEVEFAGKDEVKFGMNFTDVSEGNWFYDDVAFAVEYGIFDPEGMGNMRFEPYLPMSRAMLVAVLYRLEGEPAVIGGIRFEDVEQGRWYTNAVIWGAGNGIILGCSETEFRPDGYITREQMATILYRYAKYKGYDVSASNKLTHYSDYSQLSLYALDAMKWANAEGLITGRGNSILAPKDTAARAEVAAIFHRFVENVVR